MQLEFEVVWVGDHGPTHPSLLLHFRLIDSHEYYILNQRYEMLLVFVTISAETKCIDITVHTCMHKYICRIMPLKESYEGGVRITFEKLTLHLSI